MGEKLNNNKGAKKPLALLETLWFGLDYGSILTAFALDRTVKSLGYDTLLTEKPDALWTEHYAEPDNIAGSFIRKHCALADKSRSPEDLSAFAKKADAVIAGSDVIWSYNVCTNAVKNRYFLDYAPDSAKKLSYASSFGLEYSGPFGEELLGTAACLKRFAGISVGSCSDADTLRERFGMSAETVLDPVFLCGRECFEKAAANAPCKGAEKAGSFIFNYIKYGNERKRLFLNRCAEILTPNNFSPVRTFININMFPESKEMLGTEVAWHITAEDWLYYLINSEFVLTDDIYGIYFALVFNKPFAFIESLSHKDISTVSTFLSSLGLEDRIVFTEDDLRTKEYLFRQPVRYKKVNRLLDGMRDSSLAWLRTKLSDQEEV